ncbi:hypothetical protein DMN91_005184 [Ooceraea biroi]|uniref:NPC2-like protein n=1 Tax=Ooceraea biroi TaxID=2015173 RepID=A0A026WYV6_OOCBI|nr:ecdysteroid-regulated 16 kDa protein [Ooceraea biroi]EZA60941.1 NPC2-like protein [Ooceraea biroi]RLU22906.1 hypothetical protein DMN91_005184 [Ooceraea biroi]
MNQIGVAVLLLCCYASTLAYIIEDCGSEGGKFNDMTVSTCDKSEEKCSFIKGVDINVSIKFTPNKDISKLEMLLYGILYDVTVPFPAQKPDVCNDPDSGITCPLKKDEEVEYKTTFVLDKQIPPVSVDVMVEFVNEEKEKIICIRYPVKLK